MENILWLIALAVCLITIMLIFRDQSKALKTEHERNIKRLHDKYARKRKALEDGYNEKIGFLNSLEEAVNKGYGTGFKQRD